MNKIILFFILITRAVNCFAQADPVLRVDTGGHRGLIRDVVLARDGRTVVSCSDDKTIRVWDALTRKETRKILGQIGLGNEGKIFAIALSPDDRWLAVGGYMETGWGNQHDLIRVYDFPTGRLVHALSGHNNAVLDLAFSPDGRYLASAGYDKTVRLWDMRNGFRPVTVYRHHTDAVHAVRFVSHGGDMRLVSAGDEHTLRVISLASGREIGSYTHDQPLHYLAVSDAYIATCGGGRKILVFDHDLAGIASISSSTGPEGLAFSPDGRLLLAGCGEPPFQCRIYNTEKRFRRVTTFRAHDNAVRAVAFLNETTAVTGGGTRNTLLFWDGESGRISGHITGRGGGIASVGISGNKLACGYGWRESDESNRFEKRFDLERFVLSTLPNDHSSADYGLLPVKQEAYTLLATSGGTHGFDDAVLIIKRDGLETARITRGAADGYRHIVYGFAGNGIIVSGGGSGTLTAYDVRGRKLADLTGHTGDVWSLAADGGRLVSGSSDQTVRVWNLREIRQGMSEMTPVLSLFISTDNEWVAWTEEGFFHCSDNGASYVGYHINRGSFKEAVYLSADQFYDRYYRPDLVEATLNGRDVSGYGTRQDVKTIVRDDGLPPDVRFITTSGESEKRYALLEADVTDTGGGIGDVTLYLNNMPVAIETGTRGMKRRNSPDGLEKAVYRIEKMITLQNGMNHIALTAFNKENTIVSERAVIDLTYRPASTQKPDLYVLAIGVDKYRDGDLRLSYSTSDAEAVIGMIRSKATGLFGAVHVHTLYDDQVRKDSIETVFQTIGQQAGRDDVFLLFVAGHGITHRQDGNYYFLPVDFRYTSEEAVMDQGVSIDEFKHMLTAIQPLKSLLLLDTCNSGSFAEAISTRGMLEKTAVNRLVRATGRAAIVASSKDQVALEGYEGHGVFTYTVLQALSGLSDYDNDRQLTISELGMYVEKTLPEITYQKWGYEQVPQKMLQGMDFPIGLK